MSTKEVALKVLADHKLNIETFHIDILNGRRPNPMVLDGLTFKAVGSVNLYLMAKKEGDSDFVEIHFMSDH